MTRYFLAALLCCSLLFSALGTTASAEDKKEVKPEELYKKLEETLTGVKMVGRFTILGKEDGPLSKEEYTIISVKKLDNGDQWSLKARIKYAGLDVTVPLKLDIKWAGDTPIITLTDYKIPLLGTFSARVVIYNNKYAGTWTHGKVGGHLFGTIEKIAEEKPESK